MGGLDEANWIEIKVMVVVVLVVGAGAGDSFPLVDPTHTG